MALSNPEVAKELGLTDDQKAKMKTIQEDARKDMPRFTPGERPSAEDMEKFQKAMKGTETKLMDVLTAEQKEKLEKMKGEKFDVSALRGGPGGPGAGRRGNRGGNDGGTVN
jgi:Spy/CpxP family protein refolding chaperone